MAEPEPPAEPPAASGYTSRVMAPVQVGLGVVVAAILVAVLIAAGLWPLAVAGGIAILAVTWYFAAVTITVSPVEVGLGQGRGRRGQREILVRNIDGFEIVRMSWGDAIRSAPAPVSNTYVVGAGTGLRLLLNDDETLNISVRDPQAAAAVLWAAGVATVPSGGGD